MSRNPWIFIGVCFLAGCQKSPPPAVIDESVLQVSRDNNEFAVDLYHKLREKPGNIVFSPYSISAALAMTYDGARGETAAQMAKTLHFPADRTALHSPFLNLHRHLVQKSTGFELSIANALWGQEGLEFEPEFRKNAQEFFGGGLRLVNFLSTDKREKARSMINDWAKNETRGKVPELLKQGDIDGFTRLVLTNAIYLKGLWETPFEESRTRPAEFNCSDGRQIMIPMMNQSDVTYSYLAEQDFEILEMPYQGNRAGFVIILPKEKIQLTELERRLSATSLADLLTKLRQEEIDQVSIPRCSLKHRAMLKDNLIVMGMPIPFDELRADFSGMTRHRMFIDKVIHEATLDVDEKGVVAAGATAVVMRAINLRLPRLHFNANRPFLFLIRDRETGSILFMGRVTDPSAK